LPSAKFDPTTVSGMVSTALLVFVTRSVIVALLPRAVFGNVKVEFADTEPPDVTLSIVNGATPWPEKGIVVCVFVSKLTIALPDAGPTAVGAKLTINVTFVFGLMVAGKEGRPEI